MVSERVAVVAAGSVLRGSLRIGRAMAAAAALVDLLYASLGLADAGPPDRCCGRCSPCARPARRGAARPPGRPDDLERLPRPAQPRDRRRGGDAAARVRDRAHYHGLQPAHDRALDDLAATKRPGPKPATSADIGSDSVIGLLARERRRVRAARCQAMAGLVLERRAPPAEGTLLFVPPGDRRLLLVALPLEVLEHGLGTGEGGLMSCHQRWPAAGPRAESRLIVA